MSKRQAEIVLHHLHRLTSASAMGPEHDRHLLERFTRRREEAAFAALLDRYGAMVLRVCRRILHDDHEAEDAFQATFLILARKAGTIRQHQSLAGWLYRVAYHVAVRARADSARREELSARAPRRMAVDPLAEVNGRELMRVLDEELQRLPEKYRLPLLLCYLEGQTQDEAARQLGWSTQVLRGRIERGRAVLRRRLLRRGFGMSAVLAGGLLEQTLAPAMVPASLSARTLRAIVNPSVDPAAVSAHVVALAESGINALSMAKLKFIVPLVLLLGVFGAGIGAGLPLLRAPNPETPSIPSPATPPAQAKDTPRRDRYGDPLPPGAVARLGSLRFRAPGEIEALAFAPDGKTLAVSSRAGLFLFDAISGKRLRHLPSRGPAWSPETPLVFSPDGKRLASLGHKIVVSSVLPVVRVWELEGERPAREYDIGQSLNWVGWSAQNEPLAIRVDAQGVLHLHDLAVGRSRRFECKEPQKNPAGTLSNDPAIACTPAGKALAVVDDKNVIHIWDTTTGRERCILQPKGDGMYSLTFSPDGGRLLSITPKAVQMWDMASAKPLYAIDSNERYGSPLFASDGKTLALVDSGETIRFWDAKTGQERGHTEGKSDFAPHIAFSPGGKWLVTADSHGSTFHLWNVATGKRKSEPVGHTNRPFDMAFTPDGRRVATGGSTDGSFRIWDARTGEQLLCLQQPDWARACVFSADGCTLFASWASDRLEVYDAASGKRRHIIKLEDPDRPDTYQSVLTMHLSADGKTLVAFSHYYVKNQAGPRYQDTLITGWDASTRKQLFQRRRAGMGSWRALSADARVLAVPHHDPSTRLREMTPGKGPMRLEDVATGEPLLTFPSLPGQTWPLAFSPDGRLLASNNFYRAEPDKDGKPGKATNTLRLWEKLTAAEVLSLPAAEFNRVAFTRDNRLMAVAAPKQEIVVWDLSHGRERRRFKGFNAEVIDLAFSPDGRRLVSGLADSTLLVWDVGPHDSSINMLGAEGAAKAWADLAGHDASRAFRARGTLALSPEETVPFLKKHLHPARPADGEHLRRLLADLASDEFAPREKAQKTLEELGDLAEPALRQSLANKPTLEVRRRVQALMERLRDPVTKPELLRSLRAVAVLEDIASPSARRLLEELAKGASESRLTREAKASLDRLSSRSSP